MARYMYHHEGGVWWAEIDSPREFGYVASADTLPELVSLVEEHMAEERNMRH